MIADLMAVPEHLSFPTGLELLCIEDTERLRRWIHAASIGFGVPQEFEDAWHELFTEAIFEQPFWTYLACCTDSPWLPLNCFSPPGWPESTT
jgi:hypothetical protein